MRSLQNAERFVIWAIPRARMESQKTFVYVWIFSEKDLTILELQIPKITGQKYLFMSNQSQLKSLYKRLLQIFERTSSSKEDRKMEEDKPKLLPNSALIYTSRTLGEGAYATVSFGQLRVNPTQVLDVAVKKPKKQTAKRSNVYREIRVMCTLNHENIVRLVGFMNPTEAEEFPWLLIEYMNNGSLASFLKTHTEFCTEVFKAKVTKEVAAAMKYLHVDKGIVHGDLHSHNVLVADFGEIIKISDFGFSFEILNEKTILNTGIGRFGVVRPAGDVAVNNRGSRWKPPEWIAGNIHRPIMTRPGDVWTFGILLFELWNNTKVTPFRGCSNGLAAQLVARGYNPLQFNTCPAPTRILNLMHRCFSIPLDRRPTFEKIVEVLEDTFPSNYFLEDSSSSANSSMDKIT